MLPSPTAKQLRTMLLHYQHMVALLALGSTVGGFVEAAFLVTVTRTALAVASAEPSVALVGGVESSLGSLVALSMLLVALRLALNVSSTRLSARLSTHVVAALRRQ